MVNIDTSIALQKCANIGMVNIRMVNIDTSIALQKCANIGMVNIDTSIALQKFLKCATSIIHLL